MNEKKGISVQVTLLSIFHCNFHAQDWIRFIALWVQNSFTKGWLKKSAVSDNQGRIDRMHFLDSQIQASRVGYVDTMFELGSFGLIMMTSQIIALRR